MKHRNMRHCILSSTDINNANSAGRKLYHPNNAALGMAAMRAGVNHWQAGLIEVAHAMVCKAYAILMVTHGSTHPITKDLEVQSQNLQAKRHVNA